MILINLLPHREAAKKRRKEVFQASILASVFAGVGVAGVIYLVLQMLIAGQEERNQILKDEIVVLEKQIEEIKNIEAEIAALRGRQKAVEDLQANRNIPVNLLNQLVILLPDGVYLKSLKQKGLVVELQGVAQSNERVSELLRNISDAKEYFDRAQLKEIVAGTVNLNDKSIRHVVNFNLNFRLLMPNAAKKEEKQ